MRKTDIAWQNASTGQVYVWLMDGTTLASHGSVFTLGDPNWQLAGTGDYDGNGKDDLLWRNSSTGENYLWFMNGTSLGSSGATLTLADQAWKVSGTGDYDGNAKADIAWRNASTGEVYVWLMDGTTLASHGSTFVLADPDWQIVPSQPAGGGALPGGRGPGHRDELHGLAPRSPQAHGPPRIRPLVAPLPLHRTPHAPTHPGGDDLEREEDTRLTSPPVEEGRARISVLSARVAARSFGRAGVTRATYGRGVLWPEPRVGPRC